jgi:hypothetical protein
MTLFLSSLINVVKVDFSFQFNGTSTSAIISLLILALCVLLPVFTFSIVWKYREFLDSIVFQERYCTLVENLKISNFWQSLYNTMQLFKW